MLGKVIIIMMMIGMTKGCENSKAKQILTQNKGQGKNGGCSDFFLFFPRYDGHIAQGLFRFETYPTYWGLGLAAFKFNPLPLKSA